ncbi:MAG: bacteriochlorophyll 4-vinyl reductase [Rubrivivax sp.]|nr:bacteriochlorophyll 4-vinyl reductase [Rubrivivax sp.]
MHAATPSIAGRIGPNAITRVAQVLPARVGDDAAAALFDAAGLARYLREPPEQMVLEAEVRRLHETLRERLGIELAADVAQAAGEATGTYLLAHRIPKPLQAVLRRLPAWLAARVLLAAISRNAWTFVGSGHFSATAPGPRAAGVDLQIRANPLCVDQQAEAPACHFYAAVFERLFSTLVHPHSQVRETACEARGDDACRFEIRWR